MANKFRVRWITPAGRAHFPHLDLPVQFSQPGKAPGKPRYETGLIFDVKDYEEAKAYLQAQGKKAFPDAEYVKLPFKSDKKDPTLKIFGAHTGEKKKPPIFDRRNRPVAGDVTIGGGSVLVLDVTLTEYVQGGIPGITAYINAVQLLHLEEGGSFTGPKFAERDDGFEADEVDENKSPFAAASGDDMHDF